MSSSFITVNLLDSNLLLCQILFTPFFPALRFGFVVLMLQRKVRCLVTPVLFLLEDKLLFFPSLVLSC